MKKTIIFATVALATLFAFSSCQKESLENNYSENNVRVITATFENNGTKTTLSTEDNKTPLWKEGDIIRVFGTRTDGNQYDDITLAAGDINNSGKSITFTTTLTGTLYAVYPASATAMTSCNGNIEFTIPAVQDGIFGSANICVAKSSTTDGTNKDHLVFSNATSVLEFSQTAATTKVLGVRVEAANAIAGPMTVAYKADGTFDTPTTSSLTGKTIKVKSSEAKDKYYIAVAPVATGKIEFEYQKAVEVATVTTEAGKTLAANTIYACSMDGQTYEIKKGSINEHDYVQVGSVKWATMNVGATTVADSYTTCNGDLFSWGDVEKKKNYGLAYYKTPAKTLSSDIKPDSGNDVAREKWGGTWRMPTSAEFKALYEACGKTESYCTPTSGGSASTTAKGVYWCTSYNNVAGCLFIVKDNGPHLFFPAAGKSDSASRSSAGDGGCYWSSTWSTDSNACDLFFNKNHVYPQYGNLRYNGVSVRPVSD